MKEYQRFIAEKGEDKRYDYPLNKDSIVFDVGGYKGDFASHINYMYKCRVYVFEPIPEFYESIKQRFEDNNDIKVFNHGIAEFTGGTVMSVDGDESSVFGDGEGITVQMVSMKDFVNKDTDKIDLLKINIEGGEYALLVHMYDNNLINVFDNIQVQFHEFIDDAEMLRDAITGMLNETHEREWNYSFVWESWRRK